MKNTLKWQAMTLVILISLTINAEAETPKWQIIMGEAVSEGERGMYAVACVMRNRLKAYGHSKGFSSIYRANLDDWCLKQGLWVERAKRVERRVFEENAPDITFGATHFENIEAFGTPYWAKSMVKTIKIKSHTFYKEVK